MWGVGFHQKILSTYYIMVYPLKNCKNKAHQTFTSDMPYINSYATFLILNQSKEVISKNSIPSGCCSSKTI